MYQYTRLPFGVASAPAIFHWARMKFFKGEYINDTLVTGCNDEEHLQRLEEVLGRIKDSGLRLKQEKYVFFQPSVE